MKALKRLECVRLLPVWEKRRQAGALRALREIPGWRTTQVWVRLPVLVMETSVVVQCPYCGQKFDLVIDTSVPVQRFTTDCEICCRPFQVFAESEPGEVTSLEVQED